MHYFSYNLFSFIAGTQNVTMPPRTSSSLPDGSGPPRPGAPGGQAPPGPAPGSGPPPGAMVAQPYGHHAYKSPHYPPQPYVYPRNHHPYPYGGYRPPPPHPPQHYQPPPMKVRFRNLLGPCYHLKIYVFLVLLWLVSVVISRAMGKL